MDVREGHSGQGSYCRLGEQCSEDNVNWSSAMKFFVRDHERCNSLNEGNESERKIKESGIY